MAVKYAEYGFRTRQSVYWVTTVLIFVMLNLVVTAFVTGNLAAATAIAAGVWLVGLALGTLRLLKKLHAMEAEHSEPTEAMKLLFEAVTMLPIAGSLPLLFVFS